MAERDHLRTPIFKKKHEAVPLQAGDLIAWVHNRVLTQEEIAPHVSDTVDLLQERTVSFLVDLRDHDKIMSLFNLAPRDPRFHYKYRIVKKDGDRRAVVQYWPRGSSPKINRKTLVLQDPADFARLVASMGEKKS